MELSRKEILLHLGLFILTFITTTLAGTSWVYSKFLIYIEKIVLGFIPITAINHDFTWQDFVNGMPYSIPFMLILTVHEFGHYFTARYYKVRTTLPYYIPLPPLPFMLGTLGAVIRLKSPVHSKKQNFDIGIAGPLAGFVIALGVLWYGFATLPPPEYIFQFHPEYEKFGLNYAQSVYGEGLPANTIDLITGKNLLFLFFEKFVADPARVPNVHELIHYPFLFAGFLSLVFTSINLLPIGQLDGGHVLYGLMGFDGHRKIASAIFILFLFYSGLGVVVPGQPLSFIFDIPFPFTIPFFIGFLYLCLTGLRWKWQNQLMTAVILFAAQYFIVMLFPKVHGYSGWLLFAFIIGRFVGVMHPRSEIEEPLTMNRKILGWFALFVFVISFTPAPIELILSTAPSP
ncbi:MAG: site-2 protease family protein [Cyclobacteriaceae bacterium]|nr:site-2 protease family protein [Cyclobacteriaceae bacterium]